MRNAARSRAKADAELQRLRKERGVDGKNRESDCILDSLEAALALLSDQLYQKSTHFLLELIQNADDNQFASTEIPSLSLSLYKKGETHYFRTDCNETGFTLKDINAITSVGQSTKKILNGGQRGYIGEKGIGFKSVFKVADSVNVVSGHYEFMFDRRAQLGMIVPVPADFPNEDRLEGNTQFLLQLKDNGLHDSIQVDLNNIEPQLLIFLRNLRVLNMQTGSSSASYLIQKNLPQSGHLGETMMLSATRSTGKTSEESKYVIVRHDASNMPKEAARLGSTTSQVVLAFPIYEDETPQIFAQKAFAFLPIDDFGFTFLIHADFLLVASREGLQYDNEWNLALRAAVQDAFLQAVTRFTALPTNNLRKNLKYKWPKYLKHHRTTFDFWNELYKNIIEALPGMRILQSRDVAIGYCQPHEVKYLPTRYRFRGEPLFDCPSVRKTQLMFAYDDVIDELRLLGVETMTKEQLFEDFSTWINTVGVSGLRAMPVEWHRQVASIFCNAGHLRHKLIQLPIIPLRDGTWAKACSDGLYLSSESGLAYVPNGIEIAIVDHQASQDPERQEFYRFLGVKFYTSSLVSSLIVDLHAKGYASIANRSSQDLINDAAYLFKHLPPFSSDGAPELYFSVTNQGQISKRNNQIYLLDDTVQPNLISKYKDTVKNPFFILDSKYERDICQNDPDSRKRFHTWLLRSRRLLKVPQLIRGCDLTPEWHFLTGTNVIDLLLAIPDHLREYFTDDSKIKELVPDFQMPCIGGSPRRLAELAVPIDSLVKSCPHLDFADLQSPDRFTFLEDYGIVASVNTRAWVRELQALASLPIEQVEESRVFSCYESLSRALDGEFHLIRSTFEQMPLVLFTQPVKRWVSHNCCVWKAPSELTRVIKLSTAHRNNKKLFRDILGVSDSGIEHVVDEMIPLQSGNTKDVAARCRTLLDLLQRYHQNTSKAAREQFERAKSVRIFPVYKTNVANYSHEAPRVVLRAISDANWHIPDQVALESTFRGKSDLLDFPVPLVHQFKDLFKRLECDSMLLSSAVQEKIEPRGTKVRDLRREKDLTAKMACISQLDLEFQMAPMPLRVWVVDSIVTVRRLGSLTVEENNEAITFQDEKNLTNIYFRSTIADDEQAEVKKKIAEYATQRHQLELKDVHLAYQLLESRLSQLSGIMARHNRFAREASLVQPQPAEEDKPDAMDVDHLESTTPERTICHRAASPASPVPLSLPTPLSTPPRRQLTTVESDQTDNYPDYRPQQSSTDVSDSPYLLQDLIPAFQDRSQNVASQAREYRVSKSFIASGARPARTRREKLRRSLERSQHVFEPPASVSPVTEDVQLLDYGGDQSAPEITVVSTPQQINTRAIGFLGEKFIHTIMERDIGGWSYHNWTSKLRIENGHPRFTHSEGNFADFTYTDQNAHMKAFLLRAGLEIDDMWTTNTTYHLEVKTTANSCDEAFFISQNQVNMMRRCDGDPKNVYIILRVFDVEGQDPGLKVFPRPWSLYMRGHLKFASAGGYHVLQCHRQDGRDFIF